VVGAPASLTFYALWDQDHALDRYRRYGVPNGKRSDVWGRFDQDRIVRTRARAGSITTYPVTRFTIAIATRGRR
jgi:hypothetical protein